MADTFTAKDASGTTTTFGSDDVGGTQYPRHKVVWGADGVANDTSAAAPLPVAPQAGELFMGQVGSPIKIVDMTMTAETSVMSTGDVIADTQQVTDLMRVSDGYCILQSVQVFDPDAQGAALDIVFLSANNSLGTENSAPSINDTNGATILGVVSVPAAEYTSISGFSVATIRNVGLVLLAATGTKHVYVGLISRGSPTYTGGQVKLRLGVLQA